MPSVAKTIELDSSILEKWTELCQNAQFKSGINNLDTSKPPPWYDPNKFKEAQNYLQNNYLM